MGWKVKINKPEEDNSVSDDTNTAAPYDSTVDTLKHIRRVGELMILVVSRLLERAIHHDNSKLLSPEKELFDKYTPLLKGSTYGSDEYSAILSELKVALNHHYENNSHHPEHYIAGINDFDLFDLIEMLVDWKAATERHDDGDIYKSLPINRDKFGISDQLYGILKNTVDRFPELRRMKE